jgi:hypothetical protein
MRRSFRLAALTGILGALGWLGLGSRAEAYPIGAVFCDSHGVRCSVNGQRISCFSKITNSYNGYCYCGHYDSPSYLTYSCHDNSIQEAALSPQIPLPWESAASPAAAPTPAAE